MPRYKVQIDQLLCQGHGVCSEECPQVFQVESQASGYPKVKVLIEEPPAELLEQVQDAVDYCPNRTISLICID